MFACTLAACGGGATTVATVPAGAASATPAPSVTAVPVGSGGGSAQVSTSTGVTSTISFPAIASGAGTTFAVSAGTTLPAGVPTPAAVERRPLALGANTTPLVYLFITPAANVTLANAPGFSFTVGAPPSPGTQYFMGLYDPSRASAGYSTIAGPGSVSGNTVSFGAGSAGASFTGGVTYVFVFYSQPGAATGTPAASPSPSAAASASASPAASPSATASPSPSAGASVAPSATPSASPAASPSPSPSASPGQPTPAPVFVTPIPVPTGTTGPLALSSATVAVLPPMGSTVTISEPKYVGNYTVSAPGCANIALVNQVARGTIVIVSLTPGSCSFTVTSQDGKSITGSIVPIAKTLTGALSEYSTNGTSTPVRIVTGPDGNLWFTEAGTDKIARMSPAGVVTGEFAVSGIGTGLRSIAVGGDGNLWFTEKFANKIGRLTTAGVLTEFPLSGGPSGIIAGPDGALWITENTGNAIARMTTDGTLSGTLGLSPGAQPAGITPGADGNMWFAEVGGNGGPPPTKIGRVTMSGVLSEFSLAGMGAIYITPGADGNLWFSEFAANRIGKMTTAGNVLGEFSITGGASPNGIVSGPDGNLWFAESGINKIGVMSSAGSLLGEVATTGSSTPIYPTVGPDGAIWFTEQATNKIGRIQ